MAFSGLKKQINKANQYVSEKIGGIEGTKFTEDYMLMERKTDVTARLVDELLVKTEEFLQPNPASRTKLSMSSRIQGTKTHAYPQPEGMLGETMSRFGKELGEDSAFSQSLIEMGEALKEMSEVKYALEDNVKQNFLEPLTHLQSKDLKDVMHHRKKLEGRRLDFDCKKRKKTKGTSITDDEIRIAGDKFEESFNLASMGMHNVLQNDIEQISQLSSLAESLYEYYSQCTNILESLNQRLAEQKNAAVSQKHEPYVPKKLHELNLNLPMTGVKDNTPPGIQDAGQYNASPSTPTKPSSLYLGANTNSSRSPNASPLPSPVRSPARSPDQRGPSCQALYDFEPENQGELAFKEGDIIKLTNQIDDNWFEGTVNGRSGLFPVSYVQVLVPFTPGQ